MMHLKIVLLLVAVACFGYAVTQDAGPTTVEPTSTSPASSTVTKTTHASPTTEPLTSTARSSHVTMHTTEAPTTPKPVDIWSVKGENGTYCILLKATFLIEFRYKSKKGMNETVPGTVRLDNSNSVMVNGSCGSTHQSIELGFLTDWKLTLTYEKTHGQSYYQSEVHLHWNLITANFSGAPEISGDNNNMKPMFNTSKAGYLCLARTNLYDNTSVENGLLSIYTEQLKFEAFQEKTKLEFSDQYERCKEDTISNLVPIIVGACLGGLIIIVLIAYLIGRKRSRRGYESV